MSTCNFCGSLGINTAFGFSPHTGGIDGALIPAAIREEILAENLIYSDNLVGGNGITGWIDSYSIKLRNGQRLVSGGFLMEIGPHQLMPWCKALVGNAAEPTSDVFTTKTKRDSVPYDISLMRDLVAHGYRHCELQRAVIRGSSMGDQGQVIQMALSFLGVEEESITFPTALALPDEPQYPWLLGDARLTYGTLTCPLISFELTIDNQLKPVFRNQLTPGCFQTMGRKISLDFAVPYGDGSYADYLYDNTTDRQAKLSFVSDNLPAAAEDYSTIFDLPNTRRVSHRHNTASKAEIPLQVKLEAYIKGTSPAMKITNVIPEVV